MRKEQEKKENNKTELGSGRRWPFLSHQHPVAHKISMQSEKKYAEKSKRSMKSSSPSLYVPFTAAPAALVATHMRLRSARADRTHTF